MNKTMVSVKPKNQMKLINIIISLAISLLISSQAIALSTDRDQPADIEADDIEFDFKKGTRIYLDNVLVVQGTLRLKADKLVGIYKDGELEKATAWGSLARFKQRPDDKPDDVEGWAKKIVVDQKANTLTLIGKAAIKQGGDTARGDTIIYNMATDTLKVKGKAKIGSAGKAGTTKPKRKLEDPFKDNNDGPAEPTKITPKSAANKDDKNADGTDKDEANEQADKPVEYVPAPTGRSRLILQPK